MSAEEIVEKQNEIIRMQSRVIDDLFITLAQVLTAEEIGNLKSAGDLRTAAKMIKEIQTISCEKKS